MSTDKDIVSGNKLIAVVYQIRNIVNGKLYVGSSASYSKRKKRHFECLKSEQHHCKPLQRAFNKYGLNSFVIEVLEKFNAVSKSQILEREQFYLDTLLPKYNVCKIAGSQLGSKRNKAFRLACSNRMKGKPTWNKGKKTGVQSEETKAKRASALMGRTHSEETKLKMSKKAIGRKFTDEHKINLSKAKIQHGKYSIWQSSYC